MRTRAERTVLTMFCVASHFQLFSDKANRGPNWSKDEMPNMISSWIQTQAFMANIPEKHYAQMKQDGLDFYSRYLEPIMEK